MENFEEQQKQILLGDTGLEDAEMQNISAPSVDNPPEEALFGKPEKYDYSEITLPENYSYNEELLNEFNELAAKYDLSQKSANELMNVALKHVQMINDENERLIEERRRQKIMEYKQALMNDKVLGGNDLFNSMRTANTAYEYFATPKVQQLLHETGLNCHPAVVEMFRKIGKQMENDTFYGVNSAPVLKESREDILYPTMQ